MRVPQRTGTVIGAFPLNGGTSGCEADPGADEMMGAQECFICGSEANPGADEMMGAQECFTCGSEANPEGEKANSALKKNNLRDWLRVGRR